MELVRHEQTKAISNYRCSVTSHWWWACCTIPSQPVGDYTECVMQCYAEKCRVSFMFACIDIPGPALQKLVTDSGGAISICHCHPWKCRGGGVVANGTHDSTIPSHIQCYEMLSAT